MNPNSWMIPVVKIEEFKQFCLERGFTELTPQGEYEILRMRPEDGSTPLLVFRKKRELDYYTTFGIGKDMARDFGIAMKQRRQS